MTRLVVGETGREGSAGDLIIVPAFRHALEAFEDSAVLLTVSATCCAARWCGSAACGGSAWTR